MCHDLSHGITLLIWNPAFINADPRQAHASALVGCKLAASDPRLSVLLSSAASTTSRGREGELAWLRRGASKGLGHQSWPNRGQNMVNGGDLSSNCSSGATLGLISEVLKVGLYGVYHVLKIFSVAVLLNSDEVAVYFCEFQNSDKFRN